MNLDDTLSQEMKDAIDMGIFPDIADAGKGDKGKYPDLSEQQFADPANRAFPIDTSEHCRAAMVYLNKYFNNKSSGGVTANYTPEKFKGVHNRIVKAMKKFGIEHNGCSICEKNTKGGLEDMPKEEIEAADVATDESEVEATEEVVEAAETTEEVEEESTEEVEASEDEVLETDVEPDDEVEVAEAEATEEVVSEESVEESTDELDVEASESEASDNLLTQLKGLGDVLTEIITRFEDVEASTEASEEKTEVEMLSEELAKANEKLRKYEAMEIGTARLGELAKEGIVFAEEDKPAKVMRFGAMSEEDFSAHREDLLSVIKASTPVKEDEVIGEPKEAKASTGVEVPTFFLPNVESPEKIGEKESFKKIYG